MGISEVIALSELMAVPPTQQSQESWGESLTPGALSKQKLLSDKVDCKCLGPKHLLLKLLLFLSLYSVLLLCLLLVPCMYTHTHIFSFSLSLTIPLVEITAWHLS